MLNFLKEAIASFASSWINPCLRFSYVTAVRKVKVFEAVKFFTAVMAKLSTLCKTGPSFSVMNIPVFLQNLEILQAITQKFMNSVGIQKNKRQKKFLLKTGAMDCLLKSFRTLVKN